METADEFDQKAEMASEPYLNGRSNSAHESELGYVGDLVSQGPYSDSQSYTENRENYIPSPQDSQPEQGQMRSSAGPDQMAATRLGNTPSPAGQGQMAATRLGSIPSPPGQGQMASTRLGSIPSPAGQGQMAATRLGNTPSPAGQGQVAATRLGNTPSPAGQDQMAATRLGNTPSPDGQGQMAATRLGNTPSPAGQRQMVVTRPGNTPSPVGQGEMVVTRQGNTPSPAEKADDPKYGSMHRMRFKSTGATLIPATEPYPYSNQSNPQSPSSVAERGQSGKRSNEPPVESATDTATDPRYEGMHRMRFKSSGMTLITAAEPHPHSNHQNNEKAASPTEVRTHSGQRSREPPEEPVPGITMDTTIDPRYEGMHRMRFKSSGMTLITAAEPHPHSNHQNNEKAASPTEVRTHSGQRSREPPEEPVPGITMDTTIDPRYEGMHRMRFKSSGMTLIPAAEPHPHSNHQNNEKAASPTEVRTHSGQRSRETPEEPVPGITMDTTIDPRYEGMHRMRFKSTGMTIIPASEPAAKQHDQQQAPPSEQSSRSELKSGGSSRSSRSQRSSVSDVTLPDQKSYSRDGSKLSNAVMNDLMSVKSEKTTSSRKSAGSSSSGQASLIERINRAESSHLIGEFGRTGSSVGSLREEMISKPSSGRGLRGADSTHLSGSESVPGTGRSDALSGQEPLRNPALDSLRTASELGMSFQRYGSMQSIPEHVPAAHSDLYSSERELHYKTDSVMANPSPTSTLATPCSTSSPQCSSNRSTEDPDHSDVTTSLYDQESVMSESYQSEGFGLVPVAKRVRNGRNKDTQFTLEEEGGYRGPDDGASMNSHASSDFITAVEKGDSFFVKKALDNPNLDPEKKTRFQKRTALHLAAGYGQFTVAEELLYAGVEASAKAENGRTPLHEAAQGGHDKVLQLLLDYTRDVEAKDRDGRTACHLAAYHGEVKCMEILMDKGAQLAIKDNGKRQPAHMAAMRNHRSILEYLYDKGVDLSCEDSSGKLPVHYAAQFGALACLICLVERECDITLSDSVGNLPIHFAAWNDNLDCMRFLVKQGTSLEVTQGEGRTPAHVAALHGSFKVLHWLCERGCNVESQDKYLSTPLHLAGEAGKAKCFNCLLQHDADLAVINKYNSTPLESAKKMGHKLAMEKAMSNKLPCPLCRQQYEYEEWEEQTAPPPVVRTVSRMATTAFSSPMPKAPEKVLTPIEISAEKRKKKLLKKKRKQSPVGRNTEREGSSTSKSIFSYQKEPDGGKRRLPKRDLPTKYFGEHLTTVGELYKLKI